MTFSRKSTTAILALVLAWAPLAASADVEPGIGLGTTGYAFSFSVPGDHFGARLQYGSFDYNTTIHSSDNAYSGQLQLRSLAMLADYHPFGNTFTLTTGAFFPNFSLTGAAVPNADGSFTINNITFTGIQTVGGTIKWTKTAPYVGFGFRPRRDAHGLAFTADLGAAFIGSPDVRITATGSGASNPAIQSSLASEQQSIQSSANFRVFPIVSIGLAYRFGARASHDEATQEKNQTPPKEPQHGNVFQGN